MDKRAVLENLSKDELIDLLHVSGKDFWNVQGNWIYWVENTYGLDKAGEADEAIFGPVAMAQTHRVKKLFNLGDDVQALLKSLELVTYTYGAIQPEFRDVDDKGLTLYITKCGQDIRKTHGRDELPCKKAGLACFINHAQVINPRFKTSCLFCPPDEHPNDAWCAWRFDLE